MKYIEMRLLFLNSVFLTVLFASVFPPSFDTCFRTPFHTCFLCVCRYGAGSGLGEKICQGLL